MSFELRNAIYYSFRALLSLEYCIKTKSLATFMLRVVEKTLL